MLFHLLVMLRAGGVSLDQVMASSNGARDSPDLRKRRRGGLSDRVVGRWTKDAMDQRLTPPGARPEPPHPVDMSLYRQFSRDEWAHLRADTPLTLTIQDIEKLQSLNDPISLDEVVAIYLPLSRLPRGLRRGRAGPVPGHAALPCRPKARRRCLT